MAKHRAGAHDSGQTSTNPRTGHGGRHSHPDDRAANAVPLSSAEQARLIVRERGQASE